MPVIKRTSHFMTEDEIYARSHSVFAQAPHESRSDRYAYIPTIEVLRALAKEGFGVTSVQEATTRKPGKREYTKHLLRLRHRGGDDSLAMKTLNSQPEIVLLNSHDGSCSYRLYAGIIRFACCNGLIVADGPATRGLSVHHKGDVAGEVIEGSYRVLDESRTAMDAALEWSGIELDRTEQLLLAEAARDARFAPKPGELERDRVDPATLLRDYKRRPADKGNDLWMTMNRIQENITDGNMGQRTSRNAQGYITQRRKPGGLGGIDKTVSVNRAIWSCAETMAEKLDAYHARKMADA